ncbi:MULTISPECIES: Abi family protein [Deefgea]|uniref:Abi family protein n=1 Tax=Deefgea chitinilytica TaxID=570276 RepID=A0ABS2C8R1_9NEIS|nr:MULTISPECIES: Abi family protein [Deefgea]MBM5570541.1 hypothetical protein [Deefgea chitinilytica]MBM9887770.1 Abi family protein [Deefgea sp. CFH1-16]
MKYAKSPLSIPDQIAHWQAKGLQIPDLAAATQALTFIGYFRLRGYALPWMHSTANGRVFNPGTTLSMITDAYRLDHELRGAILRELETIEVGIRTVISNTMSDDYGPFWYFNQPAVIFGDIKKRDGSLEAFPLQTFLAEVDSETRRSKDAFAQHFYSKYTDPALPPSWLMAECVTFGKWSKIYQHLQKADASKPHPKKAIAKVFQLQMEVLESWLHALTVLRNICAHHGRVWNRRFSMRPKVFTQQAKHFTDPQSFYSYAVVIRLLSRAINPNSDWPRTLQNILASYPGINPADMGFPVQWQADALWL